MENKSLYVVAIAFAVEISSAVPAHADEARMFLSRRGPPAEGCIGPIVGEVPRVGIPGGGQATLHLWLNVDGLPDDATLSELGWSIEFTSSNTYSTPPVLGSTVANPLNPGSGDTRWNSTFVGPAMSPYLVYRAGGISMSSPSIGTTDAARLDPAYDIASNSFYLGSVTADIGFEQAFYYLRNGRLTKLKSGEPIDLHFGDSDLAHSGAMPDAGDPATGQYYDALVAGLGRPTLLGIGIYPFNANSVLPELTERRINLANGPGNAAYCARGEWYSRVAVDNFHGQELEVYVDFASVSGPEVAERLLPLLAYIGADAVDVSSDDPLRNGIDYDVRLRLSDRPRGESFFLYFDTEFDFPGYPIANIGIVPEPSSIALTAIGCILAATLSRIVVRPSGNRLVK